MIGYQIVERRALAPEKPNGIRALPNEIGILDFLRELEADEFPFPRLSELRIVGLEEVLYAARPNDEEMALNIRQRLVAAALDLSQRMMFVQVVFQETLMKGDTLWVEYRGHRLPIGHIFDSPPPETDANGNRFFRMNFSLTGV
jgi:hypothetical protein